MKPDFSQIGFQYQDDLVMAYIGGSHAHGAKVEGTDDTDWYGIFIEPPEKVMGVDHVEHFVHTTGGKTGGNGPKDVDVCLYTLRKWAGLAAKGNPSSLYFLFAPTAFSSDSWYYVSTQSGAFLSKGHVFPFLGFANDQLRRLFGEKGQKNIHRAHLEEQYGYDTKYAMHVIRLYGEAKELMETGRITLPRPNKDELIAIRQGKYKLSEIREMANQLEFEATSAAAKSPLPDKVDRDKISNIISDVYLRYWENRSGIHFWSPG